MVGKTVSHYKIIGHLGEGGMGVVYKAEDTKLNRLVALKFLPSKYLQDKEKEQRFIQEAKAASALDHLNICTIYEINETETKDLYIVMGYYEGQTLKQKIEEGPIEFGQALDIASQIAQGLKKAHEKGITHRDIKPGNIIFSDDGVVKILDFGLAKMAGVTMTVDGSTLGTCAYMSPEQSTGGEVGHRSDIWSLGVILFEMISGLLPFRGEYAQALIYSILNSPHESLANYFSDIPPEFLQIMDKILAKNPDARYQDLEDFRNDLDFFRQDSLNKTTKITTTSLWKKTTQHFHTRKTLKSTTIVLTPQKRRLLVFSTVSTLIVLVIATIFISGLLYKQDTEVLKKDKPSIAVMYFNNRTKRDGLGKMVVDMMITNLSRFDKLDIVSSQRLFDILKKNNKEGNLDRETATEVARKAKVNIMIIGSVIELGNTIRLNVQLSNVETGRNFFSQQVDGKKIDDLFNMVDNLTQKIVEKVGIKQEIEVNITDITTKSLDAYDYYVKSIEKYNLMSRVEALEYIDKAIELDTTFASAYLINSQIQDALGNHAARISSIKKAKKYSNNSSKKEKLYIEAAYADLIENNMLKRIEILEQITEEFPKEKQAHYLLGTTYFELGNEKSFEMQKKALKLDPDYGPALNALVYLYLKPENVDFDKALSYLQRYLKIFPDEANPHDTMGDIYFSMGRIEDAIEKYKVASKIDPGFSEYKIAYMYAILEEYNMAFYWAKRSIGLVYSKGMKGERLQFQGFLHYWLGEYSEAEKTLLDAKRIYNEMDNDFGVAITSFYLYTVSRSQEQFAKGQKYLDAMDEYFDSETTTEHNTLYSMLKMLIDLNNFDLNEAAKEILLEPKLTPNTLRPKKWTNFFYNYVFAAKMVKIGSHKTAIKFCEANNKIKIRVPSQIETYIIYNLTRKNVLATAYYKNGEIDKAIAEYDTILQTNPSRNDLRLIHPEYHMELGMLHEEKGEIEKAKRQYEYFLDYWNITNPNDPKSIDVKKRIANLTKPESRILNFGR